MFSFSSMASTKKTVEKKVVGEKGWHSPKLSLLRQRPICNFRVRWVIGRRWVVEEGRRYWHEFRLNSNPDPSLLLPLAVHIGTPRRGNGKG